MTCIVGLIDDDGVWLGADSMSHNHYTVERRIECKIFERYTGPRKFGIAVAGSWWFSQVLRYHLRFDDPTVIYADLTEAPEPIVRPDDPDEYMGVFFTRRVQAAIESAIGTKIESDRYKQVKDGVALVAFAGRLYSVWASDGQVSRHEAFHAHGSGAEPALGSLVTTRSIPASVAPRPAKERVELALYAASEISPHVAPPFTVQHFAR